MGRRLLSLSIVEKLGLALVWAVAVAGCKPQIGDKCQVSTDCSQTGDRLCDVSEPDGYCTIYNCEPKGSNASAACPDEGSCIAFGEQPSPVLGCQGGLGSVPYQRTFCLKICKNGSDCRGGYVCEDPQADPRFAAVDVDGPTKVCMVAFSAEAPDGSNGVCTQTSPSAGGASDGTDGSAESGTAGGAEPGAAGTNPSGGNDGI